MKRIYTLIALCLICANSFADIFLRYNLAGYEPKRKKRIIVMSDRSIRNAKWSFVSASGDTVLQGTMGKHQMGMNDHLPKMFNYEINFSKLETEGDYTLAVKDKSATVKIKNNAHVPLINEVVRYLRQQRSGTKTALDHKISHEGDAKCPVWRRQNQNNEEWLQMDEEESVDMLGGWYDAGDYIKFTLTTSYTTYFLLRSYATYPEIMQDKNYSTSGLVDILDEAKWGLDYLMKCMPNDETFIIQVADETDHREGERLPDQDRLDGLRKAYHAFSPTQMGYTAAALALGSKIMNDQGLTKEAEAYKKMAIKVYAKAVKENKLPAWYQKGWEIFYKDESKEDNLQLAAWELYELTGEKEYLNQAKGYADIAKAAYWVSWGNPNMVAHNLMQKKHPNSITHWETDLNNFQGKARLAGNLWGMPHDYTWATMYSFFGVGSGAFNYSKSLGNKIYLKMGLDVLDYTLGQNNWGMCMVATNKVPNAVKNIYSQIYRIQKDKEPIGAIAEGPGDRKTHDELKQYFQYDEDTSPFSEFNTPLFVFFDQEHDFQCMETTIGGLADGIYFFTVAAKYFE